MTAASLLTVAVSGYPGLKSWSPKPSPWDSHAASFPLNFSDTHPPRAAQMGEPPRVTLPEGGSA